MNKKYCDIEDRTTVRGVSCTARLERKNKKPEVLHDMRSKNNEAEARMNGCLLVDHEVYQMRKKKDFMYEFIFAALCCTLYFIAGFIVAINMVLG